MPGKQNAFLALSGAAIALPAFSASQPAETTVSLKASTYKESDVSDSSVLSGSDDRYDIDIGQFRLVAPAGRHWSFDLGVSRESMSGASPWATLLGASGEPGLIMSGATIHESRTETNLTVTRHGDRSSFSFGLSQSNEDDYEARALSIGGEWDFNNRLSTLSLGFSYSSDDIRPTDARAFGRVSKEDKQTRSLKLGWSQVLNRNSVLSTGLTVTRHQGYLTDPYKLRDVRPDERTEWALALRYRRYFDNRNAALHLDYRYYDDDWGIDSHTVYSAWYQSVGASFKIVPNVRYYSQSEADFYLQADNFALPATTAQSSDFRLSGYDAWSFGLKGIYSASQWDLTLSVDQYRADGGDDHPALLEFTLTSFGLTFRF